MSQLRAEILVGQRYRFLNRIGTDPLTETWKAFDTRLGRPVALQLLTEHARGNTSAQASLRAIAGAGTASSQQDASGRRILDGGEDPIYGPFVVSELGSGERRLPTLDPSLPVPPDGLRTSPTRGLLIMAAVAGVLVVLVVAFVIIAFVLVPSNQGPATASPTVPPVAKPQGQASPLPASQASPQAGAQAKPQPSGQPSPQTNGQPTPLASGPPTPPAGGPPTPQASTQLTAQPPPTAGSPVDIIRQHYAFIDAKRYAEGYALMDAHLRSLNSSADYQSWFVDKISVKPISLDLASQNGTEAVVRSLVETTDRVNGQNVTKQVSEEFVLHAEDGAWRIDQVSSL